MFSSRYEEDVLVAVLRTSCWNGKLYVVVVMMQHVERKI